MNRFVNHLLISLLIAFGQAILLFILLFTGPAMLVLFPALVLPFPFVLWYLGMSDAKSIGEGIGFSFLYFFSWVIGIVILALSRYPWVGYEAYNYLYGTYAGFSYGDINSMILPAILLFLGLLIGVLLFGLSCGYINKKKQS